MPSESNDIVFATPVPHLFSSMKFQGHPLNDLFSTQNII